MGPGNYYARGIEFLVHACQMEPDRDDYREFFDEIILILQKEIQNKNDYQNYWPTKMNV
jgi:hypothetical protein